MLRKPARRDTTFALLGSLLLGACGSGSGGPDSTQHGESVAPSIVSQPTSQAALAGQSVSFSVVATGSEPLQYQWDRNGSALSGATSATYTQTATAQDNGAVFAVTVSNPAGSVQSAGAQLTVSAAPAAPAIITQPANQTVPSGQSASFSVVASGTAPLAYQWRRNGSALAGANAATYTTPPATSDSNGSIYSVLVSNALGSVASANATLAVTAAPSAPTITTEPVDLSVQVGQGASFSVVASGSAPLSYQWRRNGTAIAGATGASYSIAATTSADSGALFSVLVSNGVGSIASAGATLTVTAAPIAPTITTQPASQSVQVGQNAVFSVVASGTTPLSYQWSRNGSAISGATAASYNTPATTSADNGAVFSVLVSNAAGSITSGNATLTVTAALIGTDVVTYKNDPARTGQNLTETVLTPANVNAATFGKLRFLGTDGKVDGQPLYLSALNIGGVSHNVVFAATENDSVYAFDADTGAPLWQVSLIPAGEQVSDPVNCDNVLPTIGITSTPVIDRSAGAHGIIYVVAMTVSSTGTTHHQRLHALDITTGAEVLGGPTDISATFPAGSGSITFDPQQYVVKAAMLLLNNTLYIAWGSHCDNKFYTGWLMAYSASTLGQSAVLNVAPNGGGIGPAIWMGAGGIAADTSGNLYVMTGNGAFEQTLDPNTGFPNLGDFGDSILKISTAGGSLKVADYFSPSINLFLANNDIDLGSAGILLLPDQLDAGGSVRHLAVGAGKDGNIYVVSRDSLGHFSATSDNIWQELTGALGNVYSNPTVRIGGVWGTPAYFNSAVYYCPNGLPLRSYAVSQALLVSTPASQSAVSFPYPGCSPTISASGATNGIVWAHMETVPAALYAFDATNLGTMLYNSNQAAGGRDQLGAAIKFVTPTVADGKVFVQQTNGIAVFGLL